MAFATLGASTSFVIGTTAVAVCATNTERRGVRIENTGAASVFYGFGTNNAATTLMHILVSTTATLGVGAVTFGPATPELGGRISLPAMAPAGDLSIISAATNAAICVTEW